MAIERTAEDIAQFNADMRRIAAANWEPTILHRALSPRVLAVARTRIEGAWAAYCDAVPGKSHKAERNAVLETGAKLDENVARMLFPSFAGLPYAY